MKLRKATLLMSVTALCFLVTSPAWAAASICDSIAGNVIVNCGFETGDFTGWTLTGNTGFTGVTSGSPYVNSGTYGAYLGPVGSDGFLSQSENHGRGAPVRSFEPETCHMVGIV